jgi:phosphate transport system substrate-binding protein
MKRWLALFTSLTSALLSPAFSAEYISIRGTPPVGRILDVGGAQLKAKLDVDFKANTDGSSLEAIYYMANGAVDLAMTPRHMTPQEQASKPDKQFFERVVGYQALVIIVSDELWRAGIHALTKEQFRSLYEGDIKNWRDVGGPNKEVTYYNRSSTYGVWDQFMIFLYGDVRKAPLSRAEAIDSPDELKTGVQFSTGSFSVLEFPFYKEGEGLHALGIKLPDGSVVEPTLANLANGRYEMMRPLVFSTNRQPTGKVRELLEYLMSPDGQALVKKSGNVPAVELDAEKDKK